MKVFKDFEDLGEIPFPVLTIGTFDGVHLGHQAILQRLNAAAEKIGGESVLFTFYPHPRMVLYPESHGLKLIQTQEEKLNKLERIGLKNVIVYPFTKDFSRLTATEFVRDYLVNKLKVKKLIIGYDHQFGKNREGGIDFLRSVCDTYGFEVVEISAQEIDDVNVSSTKIRNAILEGDVKTAKLYLGEPFEINGTVVQGKGIGRELGFPTANIDIHSDIKILPKQGVYCVNVEVDNKSYMGMLNLGVNPTIDDKGIATIEVNLLDFESDLYGKSIRVQFLERIRDELKFNNLEELKNQIKLDEEFTRNFFSVC